MSLTVNEITMAANSAAETIARQRMMLAGSNINTKHTRLYAEFGWIDHPVFEQFYQLYRRNPVARAIISKLNKGTFQTMPQVIEGDIEDSDDERSDNELAADDFLKTWWPKIQDGDRRNLVGKYSALILSIRDAKKMDQPVTGALNEFSIFRIRPVWEDQLEPIEWNQDEASEDYGDVSMYAFTEYSSVADKTNFAKPTRLVNIHPDRVIIINEGVEDYTLESGESMLEAALNSLMDIEKVSGGSAEGFYKNAARQLAINFDKDTNFDDMMRMYGANPSDPESNKLFREAFNERARELNIGADSIMMGKAMDTKVLSVAPADPEPTVKMLERHAISVSGLPYRSVIGNETGERASTEDNVEKNNVLMARQTGHVNPILTELLERMMRFGVLPMFDFSFKWPSLNEAKDVEKLELMEKAIKVGVESTKAYAEPIIKPNEIRAFGPDSIRELDEFTDEQMMRREDSDDDIDDQEEE